jgi:hypothetical protein
MVSPRGLAAYYDAPIEVFLKDSDEQILGTLTANSPFGAQQTQVEAWREQVRILKTALDGVSGHICLEFTVPRLGSRIDAVLLMASSVFVLEFKVGQAQFTLADTNQAWDYALDLKNFHAGSRDLLVRPVLIATAATANGRPFGMPSDDGVYPPAQCTPTGLAQLLRDIPGAVREAGTDAAEWIASPYRPTPTIIEAARALYSQHSVAAIARSDAGAKNLAETSHTIDALIEAASRHNEKAVIFVTGVPGAGKTLVGLNVATQHHDDSSTHAVFLSGNGPLVAVLREALVRDERLRRRREGQHVRKGDVQQKVKAFIQNVHHFRDAGLRHPDTPPDDRVAIFDEAQRAWNLRETANFMKRKKGLSDFEHSEPAFLLSCMSRHPDWAVVVCLVGDGQEINRGEAGIAGWLEALVHSADEWAVYAPAQLKEPAFGVGAALGTLEERGRVHYRTELHLATSMRSFRAETLSAFVRSLLDRDVTAASRGLQELVDRYPLALTRDLDVARKWIRARARGSERVGLLASSRAMRLRPHAIDVRVKADPVHWFLAPSEDVRSSDFLEDAATEFQVQGLEVDWACVTWDADLRSGASAWSHHNFQGSRWTAVNKTENQQFVVNTYRVLLTRARQGMVIFVPPGNDEDRTRPPSYYNGTFNYLRDLGIPTV